MHRRSFLATAGTVSAAGLAGCAGILDSGGGSAGFETAARWGVAPDEGQRAVEYEIFQSSPARSLELAEYLPADSAARIREPNEYAWGTVDPADVDLSITVDTAEATDLLEYSIYDGSFDLESAREALAAASEVEPTTHRGFDVYTGVSPADRNAPDRSFAVGDGVILEAGGFLGATASVEDARRIVDAGVGAGPRLVEQHEDAGVAASQVDTGLYAELEVSDPEEPIDDSDAALTGIGARSARQRLDGDDLVTRAAYVFVDASAVTREDLDRWLAEQRAEVETEVSVDVDLDGRVAVVTSRLPAGSVW